MAYRLSAMGFPVALTRGGSPSVDLMVGSLDGKDTVSIQVKTSNNAWRRYKRRPERNHWEWDVGKRALSLRGDRVIYAFVDLRWKKGTLSHPDVFVVPSQTVADSLGPNWKRYMFSVREGDKDRYFEAWSRVTDLLSRGNDV